MKVAVIGASNKPERYSYQAVTLLQEKGHDVYPVHQRVKDIEGVPVYSSINDIADQIDTITLYVGPAISNTILDDIISKKPRRIILNPGTENSNLEYKARAEGIKTVHACTLVMLRTNQF
ncbi:MAG: CoA-binding protein [Candidatus Ancaeobacter aquaticus]|nr:CoA-binding protein [Candidatus Ancaeobacter aquaticus]